MFFPVFFFNKYLTSFFVDSLSLSFYLSLWPAPPPRPPPLIEANSTTTTFALLRLLLLLLLPLLLVSCRYRIYTNSRSSIISPFSTLLGGI